MLESNETTHKHKLNFVTLKVTAGVSRAELPYGIFDHREFCDQFIRSIIYCIENIDLKLYGFVMVSDQVHIIIGDAGNLLNEKIKTIKEISAREIIIQIGKKLISMDSGQSREKKELRKFFSQLLNSEELSFWQNQEKYTELKIKNQTLEIEPITSDILVAHLADADRNYLQLGADSFTKLMMQTMKM